MKLIETKNAVGHVLCHDMTQIIPGVTKDARFRKGHIVTEEDIPVLLSMGKDSLYVWERTEGMLHEDEAAERLRDICINENMHASQPKEGKIELTAECDGLFRIDRERLLNINMIEEIMIATRHGNTAVKKGDKLVGTRVIPLVIDEKKLVLAEQAAEEKPLAELIPWKLKTAALIVTGNEVFNGRIEDKFGPVVVRKLAQYGVEVTYKAVCDDGLEHITAAIAEARATGADMIVCSGGMSVDPDDRTPGAIAASGAEIISYGAPVLPGAMFLLGYFEDGTPIMGLPGCVMYSKATIFDLVLPRVIADVRSSRRELAEYGYGGLCLGCGECHYPICPFGKGV
jgi:hypothetical protein